MNEQTPQIAYLVANAMIKYRIAFTAAGVFARYTIYRGLYRLPLRIA
jgi:hypothetical protein